MSHGTKPERMIDILSTKQFDLWGKAHDKWIEQTVPGELYKFPSLPGVIHLFEEELERYICTHDAALVMFYGEPGPKLTRAKEELKWAADQNDLNVDQPYGAVDCKKYGHLCQQHWAYPNNTPLFNLYRGGKFVKKYNYDLSGEDMIRLVGKTSPRDITLPLDRTLAPTSKRQRFLKAMCSCVVGQEKD